MQVALRDVGHSFGDRPPLFRHIDLELRPGRVYALTGPSGSGKSTLLSMIAGWAKPSEGTIEQLDVTHVGWVFQNPHGVSRRTALDHVTLPRLAFGETRSVAEARAIQLLAAFDLEGVAASRFRDLSGGEAQRLMLARGLAAEPDLLLVDEPTAQLDINAADTVNSAFGALADTGAVVVVATHDLRTREACTDAIDLARYR